MRNMKKKKIAGFTLIELMIVVAIIGILAVIAIPNFLKFQCKAKQSEAKTNLSAIFTAEKAFYGEYNVFSTDLISINWFPDGAPAYIYGFAIEGGPADSSMTPFITGYARARKSTDMPIVATASSGTARFNTVKQVTVQGAQLTATLLAPNSTVGGGSNGFTAAATADIDVDAGTGPADMDQWTIDQSRLLRVVANDCSN